MQCLNYTFPKTPIYSLVCMISSAADFHQPKPSLSVTLTPSRHCRASADTLPVHLKLIALDLDYVWQTNSNAIGPNRFDAAMNPFSRFLSLPYLTTIDNAVGRFVTFHLVRHVYFEFSLLVVEDLLVYAGVIR